MKSIIYTMRCLTNLHAGSGEANYSIIDNEVQRDPVTGYPTIFSSGVKGAIREHFKENGYQTDEYTFGSEQGEVKQTKPGKLKFTAAQLIAYPMRTESGERPFEMVTSEAAILLFNEFSKAVGLGDFAGNTDKDDFLKKIGAAVRENKVFDRLVKRLPVAARNQLDHGRSENLWYEEIVPHESVFWFAVLYDGSSGEELLTEFDKTLMNGKENVIVQFGADATIGDGLCLIGKLAENDS